MSLIDVHAALVRVCNAYYAIVYDDDADRWRPSAPEPLINSAFRVRASAVAAVQDGFVRQMKKAPSNLAQPLLDLQRDVNAWLNECPPLDVAWWDRLETEYNRLTDRIDVLRTHLCPAVEKEDPADQRRRAIEFIQKYKSARGGELPSIGHIMEKENVSLHTARTSRNRCKGSQADRDRTLNELAEQQAKDARSYRVSSVQLTGEDELYRREDDPIRAVRAQRRDVHRN